MAVKPFMTSTHRMPPMGYEGYQGVGAGPQQAAPIQSVAEILSAGQPSLRPDLATGQTGAQQSRRIADMLTERAMGRRPTGIVDGLASLGEAFIARGANKKADESESKYQAMTQQLLQEAMQGGEAGKASLMQLLSGDPQAGMQYAMLANAPAKEEEYTLGAGARRFRGDQEIAFNPVAEKPEGLPTGMRMGPNGPEWIPGYLEGQRDLRSAGASQVRVDVNSREGWQTGPIPQGYGLVNDPNSPTGFRMGAHPGGPAASEQAAAEAADQSRKSTVSTAVGGLINSYATLHKNKAIPSVRNTGTENLGAVYSASPFGRAQDTIGSDIGGNNENIEARKTIEGLNMSALMSMISMSDISARAMDSDAEMRAWLSAIGSDQYESALTKLHVLDSSFGPGTALQQAYEDGVIDLDTYRFVTRRMTSDPMTQRMADRARRYAELGEAVDPSNLTPRETARQSELQGLLAPDGSAVTEEDVQETMAATGMTREQIIERLRGGR